MYQTQVAWPYYSSALLPPGMESQMQTILPRMDIYETADGITYVFDVPAIDQEKLNVEYAGKEMFVSGPLGSGLPGREGFYHYQERPRGSYFRSVALIPGLDSEHPQANLKNGVLEVRFPRLAEEKKPKKTIHPAEGEAKNTDI